MSELCGTCPLQCDSRQFSNQLSQAADVAVGQVAILNLESDIAADNVERAEFEIAAQDMMDEVIGKQVDPYSAELIARDRMQGFAAAREAHEAASIRANPELHLLARDGHSDATLLTTIASLAQEACANGPKRGLKIPLSRLVVPLPGSRGQVHCSSGIQEIMHSKLERARAKYPEMNIDSEA